MSANLSSYSDLLYSRIFGETDWLSVKSEENLRDRVTFVLKREFNDTSPFLVHKFIRQLYLEYGREIVPLEIKNGCVSIETKFESPTDLYGRDFHELMYRDSRYQQIFRNFGVETIYFQGWTGPDEGRSGTSNQKTSAYAVDNFGRPSAKSNLSMPTAP